MTGASRARPWLLVLTYGLVLGLSVVTLQFGRYRWLLAGDSTEAFIALVAVCGAAVGVWLGRRATRTSPGIGVDGPNAATVSGTGSSEPFVADESRIAELGLTPRELEMLTLIAEGLSNDEMAARAGVSVNTVKTHVSRVLGKLDARRRTQAVLRAREWRLIP